MGKMLDTATGRLAERILTVWLAERRLIVVEGVPIVAVTVDELIEPLDEATPPLDGLFPE